MSTAPTTQMTLIQVAATGHVLAALTQADDSAAPPTIDRLVASGLPVRGLPDMSTSPPSSTDNVVLVPAADLVVVTLPLKPEVLSGTWGWSIQKSTTGEIDVDALQPYGSGSSQRPEVNALVGRLYLTFTAFYGMGVYVVVNQKTTNPTVSSSFALSVPKDPGAGPPIKPLQSPPLPMLTSGTTFSVLVLVEGQQSFTVTCPVS